VEAALDYGEQFDGIRPPSIRVPSEVLASALADLDPSVHEALTEAIRRARMVHAAQVPTEHTVTLAPGAAVTQRWIPVRRVGLYVPGGLAVYPSSVVMNVVPAQEAGVDEIVVASPPQAAFGGWPHPTILAACALLGVTEVLAVGGAQAVALLAHGSPTPSDGAGSPVVPVDVITGPGNIFVQAAKRYVQGLVGIDAEAGPTEIAIVADAGANPAYVAADLISQAEHDPLAASLLITDSPALAEAVESELTTQAAATKHAERVATALRGPQSAIVLADDGETCLAIADAYAAEHLEIHTANAAADARRIRNAGAIFVGPYSPVPLGDYIAGSNHVLPTAGTARFASGLTVFPFLKTVEVIHYTADALAEVSTQAQALAQAEDLPAHAAALQARHPH